MYTLIEPHPLFDELAKRCADLSTQIAAAHGNLGEQFVLPAGVDLADEIRKNGAVFLVVEGHLSVSIDGKNLFFFSEGDLIGFEIHYSPIPVNISADFGVKLIKFDLDRLMRDVSGELKSVNSLCGYLSCQGQLLALVIAQLLRGEERLMSEVRHYEKDEIIIAQGDKPDLVYTLLEGAADAIVDGVKVGEICADQIFGALAVVTDAPRTATVKTRSRCVAVAIPKDQFIELIKARPQTILTLVEDMARTIASLNDQVVGLTKASF